MTELVQRLEYAGLVEDAHGNETESWLPAVDLLGRYGFDPGSTSEPRVAGHDRVVVEPTLYGPFDMPLFPRDRVIVRGDVFEVEGVVRRWRNMFSGRTPGAVVTLRLVTG